MPKFLGTKKGYHLFKNEQTGETFEVPSELVDKKTYNELTNYDTVPQRANYGQNVAKADVRQGLDNQVAVQRGEPVGPKNHPLYPSMGELLEMQPQRVHSLKRAQDFDQVHRNKRSVASTQAFGQEALKQLPSAPLAVPAAPTEKLVPVETDADRLRRLLAQKQQPAAYKTGTADRYGNPADPMKYFK